ncbi:Septin-domain-containing protein [Parasitella parasitica]|nr:Septin-domain-containing protein [Parasitella parasitica]
MSISSVDHQSKEFNFGIISINESTEPKKFQHQFSQYRKQTDAKRQHDSKSMNVLVTPKVKSLDQTHHQFRLIVCGDSGIGKTSLVHALTSTTPIPEGDHPTSPMLKPIEVLSKNSDFCVIDTCGYGALLRAEIVFSHVKSYLETQFEKTTQLFNNSIQDEMLSFMVNQSSDALCHVDACLYLIMGRLKQVDIEYMRSIHDLVNIIPVIIQPDLSLKPEAMIEQRTAILKTIQQNSIKINRLGYDTFEDLLSACKQPLSHPYCPPFVLDWSTNKRSSFHGLVYIKQALIQSKLLRSDTTQKFMVWKQLCNSFSTNSSSTATTTTTTSSSSSLQQEQQKHNIRISQYVSERRRSMEKEMLLQEQKLKQEIQTLSKERRSELILKEIGSLVQLDSENKLLVRYQQLQRSSLPPSPSAGALQHIPAQMHPMTHSPFWIALSIILSLFICYQNWNWWTYY